MPRRKPVELNINHERWLVSYADFITLLFAFFVVMYSISQVNEGKYRALSETLVEAFDPARSLKPIQVGDPSLVPSTSVIDLPGAAGGENAQAQIGSTGQLGELQEMSEIFTEQFSSLIEDQLVQVDSNEFWLQIQVKDSILFDSGSAEPSAQAQAIFAEIANVLKGYDNPVQVEGHTDNLPIRSLRYPSNWELSAARATAIVKLLEADDVAAQRLSAVGYGEHQPVASNETAEGRARNRRVVLMIAKARIARPTTELESIGLESAELNGAELQQQLERQAASALPAAEPEQTENSPEPTTEGAGASNQEAQVPVVVPVELEDGGLLFTSDPDLVRERR